MTKYTEDDVNRILEKNNSFCRLKYGTYISYRNKAVFIDIDYGEFDAWPGNMVNKGGKHIKRYIHDRTYTEEQVNNLLIKSKRNICIKLNTYINSYTNATFIDIDFGEWEATPNSVLCGSNHPARSHRAKKYTDAEISKLILDKDITLKAGTYISMMETATFIDRDFGEWRTVASSVIHDHHGHPNKTQQKRKETCLLKYGVDHSSKDKEISLKIARKTNRSSTKNHWLTNEELVCQGSYETKVVDYLNLNRINYKWQPETFKLSTGKTYRPDLYLVDEDIWVEIKGWMREDAKIKWIEFKLLFPSAELWTKDVLESKGIKTKIQRRKSL